MMMIMMKMTMIFLLHLIIILALTHRTAREKKRRKKNDMHEGNRIYYDKRIKTFLSFYNICLKVFCVNSDFIFFY